MHNDVDMSQSDRNLGAALSFEDGLARLRLTRPESGNSLNIDLLEWLADTVEALSRNGGRALLIEAEGKAFCVGGDLGKFDPRGPGAEAYLRRMVSALNRTIAGLVRAPFPVIAALQGVAAGAGMSLACSADIVICSDRARFTPAYTRSALTPDGGLSLLLPALVGRRRALDLMLLNPMLGADQAAAMGIASEVVPADRLDARATEVAKTLARGPGLAFAGVKRLVNAAGLGTLEVHLREELESLCRLLASQDLAEGIAAFLDKRPPAYRGV